MGKRSCRRVEAAKRAGTAPASVLRGSWYWLAGTFQSVAQILAVRFPCSAGAPPTTRYSCNLDTAFSTPTEPKNDVPLGLEIRLVNLKRILVQQYYSSIG